MVLPTTEDLLNSPHGLQWRLVHYGQARLESNRRSSIILAAFSFSIFSSMVVSLPTAIPSWLIILLTTNSAILVAMHSFSLVISTFLLPKLQAVSQEYDFPEEGDLYMKPVPEFSPHDRFRGFVEISYNISHTLGLFLFLLEIVLIAWVKFWDYSINACIVSTVVIIPFMIMFAVISWHFNSVLGQHVYQTRTHLLKDVEREFTVSEESIISSPGSQRTQFSPEPDDGSTPEVSTPLPERPSLRRESSTPLPERPSLRREASTPLPERPSLRRESKKSINRKGIVNEDFVPD